MVRKSIGIFFLILAAGGLYGITAASEGMDVASAGVAVAVFLVIGLVLCFKKGKTKEEKATLKAQKEAAKERNSRMLTAEHIAGLPLAQAAICTVRFDESEIVISANERTFRVSYEKIVSLKIDTKVRVQQRWGYSIPGAVIGGAAFGAAGAGLLGVKMKKRRILEEYLVITYNPRENSVSSLVFLPSNYTKMKCLIALYSPRCNGRASDVIL